MKGDGSRDDGYVTIPRTTVWQIGLACFMVGLIVGAVLVVLMTVDPV